MFRRRFAAKNATTPPIRRAAPGTLKAMKAQAERQIVVAALEKHGWHVTKTAEALGLADHSSLLKIMRRHGVRSGGSRSTVRHVRVRQTRETGEHVHQSARADPATHGQPST